MPKQAAAGDAVSVRAVVTSNKVGHDFPTGPLDIIQAWVELVVTDADGRVIFASGRRDERHFIEPGTFMFKAEPVDQYGNLIDRHNLWEMVGVRYRRSLFPGFSDTAEYAFRCSGNASAAGARTGASRLRAARARRRRRAHGHRAPALSQGRPVPAELHVRRERPASPCRSPRWRGPRRGCASSAPASPHAAARAVLAGRARTAALR